MLRAYSGSRCRRGVSIFASTRGWAGTISEPVAGRGEHEPAAPAAVLDGEVLGQPAAPGQPEDVDRPVEAEPGEHPGDDRAEGGQVVGDDRPR